MTIQAQIEAPTPNGKSVVTATAQPIQVQAPPLSEAASLMQVITNAATNPAVDIDKLERLMQMHDRLRTHNARSAYITALAVMQPKLPAIERKGKITIKDKTDTNKTIQQTPFARWEDIDATIKPILGDHGFALSFRTGIAADGRLTVTAILSHRDGHQEETTMTLPYDSSGSKNGVQAVGSSTSYGKRYTACAILNISSRDEDDDGAGSDLPQFVTDKQATEILNLISTVDADIHKFCAHFKIEGVAKLPADQFNRAIKALNAKKKAAEK